MFAFKLTVLLAIVLTGVEGQTSDAGVPVNTVAVVRETARLRCRYLLTRCLNIKWQKNSTSGQVTDISDGNRVHDRRYRLDDSTVCYLVIDNVQLTDSGTFICTISGYTRGLADLIVLEAKPTCSSSCKNDSMMEKGKANFYCALTYSGGTRPVMTWLNKRTGSEVPEVPPGSQNKTQDKTSVTRDFSWNTVAPGFPPLVCLTRFHLSQTAGWASNVAEVECEVGSCHVLSKPTCSSTCQNDSTAEKEKVDFKCTLTHSGSSRPVMTWLNKETGKEVERLPAGRESKTSVSRDFWWEAFVPGFDPLVCLTRFYLNQTAGKASKVLEFECETGSCNILYSVRKVATWPLGFASPGETITCTAEGNPEPNFEWQSKDEDGDWEDVKNETSETIEAFLGNGTSTKLRCVAKNTVNDVEHSQESLAVTVMEGGANFRTGIIIGVIVAIVIVAVIAGLIYKFFFSG